MEQDYTLALEWLGNALSVRNDDANLRTKHPSDSSGGDSLSAGITERESAELMCTSFSSEDN